MSFSSFKRFRMNDLHLNDYFSWFFSSETEPEEENFTSTEKYTRRYSSSRRRAYSKSTRAHWRNQKESKDFSGEELDELEQIFEFFDIDSSKTMDLHDLERAMQALGYTLSNNEVQEIISLMVVDGDRTIDFSEFCMIISHFKKKGKYDEMRNSFRCLDPDRSGQVTCEDLYDLMAAHCDDLTVSEVINLIRFAEDKGTGKINYEKFIQNIEIEDEKMSSITDKEVLTSPMKNKQLLQTVNNKTITNYNNSTNEDLIETEDRSSVVKAFAGPILINSAVIVHFSQSKQTTKKWPPLWKILSNKCQK